MVKINSKIRNIDSYVQSYRQKAADTIINRAARLQAGSSTHVLHSRIERLLRGAQTWLPLYSGLVSPHHLALRPQCFHKLL